MTLSNRLPARVSRWPLCPPPGFLVLLLSTALCGQTSTEPTPTALRDALRDQVLFDAPGDGHLWAAAAAYKASFGSDGFTYIPFLGSDAPHNYPVRFVLRGVSVGGRELPLADATPVRDGARVTFARGAVHEVYELAPQQVEQTFVVVDGTPGDLLVELEVISELAEDAGAAGLQWRNEHGAVNYGEAFVVDGADKTPIATAWTGNRIVLRVPAAQRSGVTVIDPVITTSPLSIFTAACASPDVTGLGGAAYAMAWEVRFSAADYDIYQVSAAGDGTISTTTYTVLDITGISHTTPRIACVPGGIARTLVAMTRQDAAGGSIWARVRSQLGDLQPMFRISSTALGACFGPDVGGSREGWLITYTHAFTSSDFDVLGMFVPVNGGLMRELLIDTSSARSTSNAQVSQSNFGGSWMVVYGNNAAGNWDVYGCCIDSFGRFTRAPAAIQTGPDNDVNPSVSSPAARGTDAHYLVTFERLATREAMAVVVNQSLTTTVPLTNLTTGFGWPGREVRVDSDGVRYVVTSGTSATGVHVGTLAVDGNRFVSHELPTLLQGPYGTSRIASLAGTGGGVTHYAVVHTDGSAFPTRIALTVYEGRAPFTGTTRRTIGCSGMTIDSPSSASLGGSMFFQFGGFQAIDFTGVLLGLPGTDVYLCGQCRAGMRFDGPILVFPGGSGLTVPLPREAAVVGLMLTAQAYAFSTGPCLNGLRLSDALDFVIR
jgi:hypothetical protein